MFFADTQNKLLFAVTKKTAAELIVERADATKPNMALTTWKGSIVRKQDIFIAKNYLTEDEIDSLNRLVVIFLEMAELRVKSHKDITIQFWQDNVDKILLFNDRPLLSGKGSISHKNMEIRIRQVYADFDNRRKQYEAQLADQDDLKIIENAIKKVKNR
ncbi:RhuM family protein [Pasteurella atlantica]|uniref:RhuM family protein n=3 Tax=Pasteurellaceae TaxID=712 RepID=A0AAW8CQ67_9PAST|nr:RhuM family protein [Pasteurella atlantica]MDP8041665.1 RhuM family protein [Pasteurella atlantica]MDP8043801.1 RhuM family protein [Pasteurella atlantica]MDP8045886.1 RhuM family protein [Pasteurella atlantica]MDP8061736.1 RhuM family protein [Pasteurella atlantica]